MTKKAIIGQKVGMTQVWDDNNKVVPVTVLEVAPLRVVSVKTQEANGYQAIQVTSGSVDADKLTKPEAGHFEKAGVEAGESLMELRLEDVSEYEVGQEITCEVFEAGEIIDVTATSKGKGFAGVMKRLRWSACHSRCSPRSPYARFCRPVRHTSPYLQR